MSGIRHLFRRLAVDIVLNKRLIGVIQIAPYYNKDGEIWRHLDDIDLFLAFTK